MLVYLTSCLNFTANAGPWKKLAARKELKVKYWHARTAPNSENPYAVSLHVADLIPLITSKTRVVAFTACSNILGSIIPVKEVVAAIHTKAREVGAHKIETCVDCVAYAPHRRVNVQDWNVDYAVFSMYKVEFIIAIKYIFSFLPRFMVLTIRPFTRELHRSRL